MKYTIPHIPPSNNKYIGRNACWDYRDKKQEWHELVAVYCRPRPPAPIPKAIIQMLGHKGPVVLSGYGCELYDNMLSGWRRHTKTARTEAANAKTEVIWCNFEEQQSLFREA